MRLAAFQVAVARWLNSTFTKHIVYDRTERGDRLLEETLELLQASGYDHKRVAILVDYVWSHPKGELYQELGSTLVTLAAFSEAHYFSMEIAGSTELLRCWDKQELIREKQKLKPFNSPLPEVPKSA